MIQKNNKHGGIIWSLISENLWKLISVKLSLLIKLLSHNQEIKNTCITSTDFELFRQGSIF